jgi:hypothetical protein
MKKIFFSFSAVVVSLFFIESSVSSLVLAADDNNEMIEVLPKHGIQTPFVDQDGQPLDANPVRIVPKDNYTVEVEPILLPAEEQQAKPVVNDRMRFTLSLGVSTTQLLTASLGVIYGTLECDQGLICNLRGVLVEVSPGALGHEVALGAATMATDPSGILGFWGSDIKLNVLATGSNTSQLYAGVTGDLRFLLFKFSVGLLRKIAGDDLDPWKGLFGMSIVW